MSYCPLRASGVANWNGPFCGMTRVLPKTFCRMKLPSVKGPLFGGTPARPTTVPPMLYVTAGQVIARLVTLAVAVPLAVLAVTTQVCVGPVGCAAMVIVYAVPV